ncbi:MAG: BACON domain-containing protein [Phycisphaerae bacterium]
MKRLLLTSVMMVCGLTAIAVATPPVSDGCYYATNFDSFTDGALNGQESWIAVGATVGNLGLGSKTANFAVGGYAFRLLPTAWTYSNTWAISFTYWYEGTGNKKIVQTDTGLSADGGTLVWFNDRTSESSPTGLTISPLASPYAGDRIIILRTGEKTARVWVNDVEGTPTSIGDAGKHDADAYIVLAYDSASTTLHYYDNLSIGEGPLHVTPASQTVSGLASTTTFSVSTTGAWSSAVTSGASWLNITSGSGTDNGTITVDVADNDNFTASRTGTIRVTLTSSGATLDVTIVQGPFSMSDGRYYQTDFENPPFAAGNLTGQDGWGADLATVGSIGLGSSTMNIAAGGYAYHALGNTWATSNSWAMSFTYWYEGTGIKNIVLTDTGLEADGGALVWRNTQTLDSSPTGLTLAPLAPPYLGNRIMILRTGAKTARVWLDGVEGTPTDIGFSGTHDSDGYIEFGNASAVGHYFDDLSIGEGPLNVTPVSRSVGYAASTTTFSVISTVDWTAAVTSGGSWLNITGGESGTDNGTITVDVAENDNATAGRTGTIRVTATSSGATLDVTIVQGPYPTALPVSNGWYYQTDFENPPFVPGDLNGQDGWLASYATVGSIGLGSQTMNLAVNNLTSAARLLGDEWATSDTWVMSFTYWYESTPLKTKWVVTTDTGLVADEAGLLHWQNSSNFANSPTGLTVAPLPAVNHIVIKRIGDTTALVWLNGVEGLPTDIGNSGRHDSDGYLEMGGQTLVGVYYDDLSIGDVTYSASDLSDILAAMDSKQGGDNWNPAVDLDNDLEITSTDLSILLGRYVD